MFALVPTRTASRRGAGPLLPATQHPPRVRACPLLRFPFVRQLILTRTSENSSNVLPLSQLVIEPGKAAWVVYLDIVCLNYDGGVLDAAVLAAVGALRNCEWSAKSIWRWARVPDSERPS